MRKIFRFWVVRGENGNLYFYDEGNKPSSPLDGITPGYLFVAKGDPVLPFVSFNDIEPSLLEFKRVNKDRVQFTKNTITFYAVRDKTGFFKFFDLFEKPEKDHFLFMWTNGRKEIYFIDYEPFMPQIKWEDAKPSIVTVTKLNV